MKAAKFSAAIADITRHIRCHVPDYYPQLAHRQFEVGLVRVRQRQFSVLCDFMLSASSLRQPLLAKVALGEEVCGLPAVQDHIQSYFIGSPDPHGSEFRAMTAVQQHFQTSGDQRLFAVRVLDSLVDGQGLLLERVEARPLTNRLQSASCFGGSRPSLPLLEALYRAGVWLRTFHRMPVSARRQKRVHTKGDFLDWVERSGEFLRSDKFGGEFFQRARPRLHSAVARWCHERLPSVPLHADFAPRNILVDGKNRVAGIDMLEQWQGCSQEDVAHFLVAIGTGKLQAISGGRLIAADALESLRGAFLQGYASDEPLSLPVVWLFEALLTISRWAAGIHGTRQQRGLRRLAQQARLHAVKHWYARYVEECLQRIETSLEVGSAATLLALPGGVT